MITSKQLDDYLAQFYSAWAGGYLIPEPAQRELLRMYGRYFRQQHKRQRRYQRQKRKQ